VNTGIGGDNVGYRLLKRAGWREGTGLGAAGQGRREPVLPSANKGSLGLGFDRQGGAPGRRQEQPAAGGKRPRRGAGSSAEQEDAAAAAALAAAGDDGDAVAVIAAARQQLQQRRAELIAGMVEQELAGEDGDAKVKRHKQALLQEREDARGRAIHR
jgi:hypothetical protein